MIFPRFFSIEAAAVKAKRENLFFTIIKKKTTEQIFENF